MATDEILREILVQPEFQKEMGTAELHYLLGKLRRRVGAQGRAQGRLGARRRLPRRRALLHLLARRLDHRHERRRRRAAGQQAARQPVDRRQRDHRHRAGRQARRRQERRSCSGRRQPEELHAPDRAADPGGAAHQGVRPGLLPPGHRRPARHRRPVRRHAQRGGELGQGRSRPAARRGRLLHRHHDRHADPHPLRAGPAQAAQAPAALRPAGRADEGAHEGVLHAQQGEDARRRRPRLTERSARHEPQRAGADRPEARHARWW